MLPLDQAEELFNPDGAAEAARSSISSPPCSCPPIKPARRLLVVATMRSDRYELLQAEPHLAAIKRGAVRPVADPEAEFKSVIEGPARRVVEAGGDSPSSRR